MVKKRISAPCPTDEFFSDWASEVKRLSPTVSFYKDGVVDPGAWHHLRGCGVPRVLVLLREVNWPSAPDGDLRRDLRNPEERLRNTFKLTAYWIYGFLNNFPSWSSLQALECVPGALDQLKRTYLRLGAVMNIKKTPGGRSINKRSYDGFRDLYAPFIKREIQEIDPDIIVCGGTFTDLRHLYPDVCRQTSRLSGIEMTRPVGLKWHAFGTHHPAHTHHTHDKLYESLISVARNVITA